MDDATVFECVVPVSRLVSYRNAAGAQPELELWFPAQWPPPQGSLPAIPQRLPTSAPSPAGSLNDERTADAGDAGTTTLEQAGLTEGANHYGTNSDTSGHGPGSSTSGSASDAGSNREAAMVKVRLQLVLREHNAAAYETADDREVAHAVERAVDTALAAQAYEHAVTTARAASKRSRKQKQKLKLQQQKMQEQQRKRRQQVAVSTEFRSSATESPTMADNLESYPYEANKEGALEESDGSHDDDDNDDQGDASSASSDDDGTGGSSGSSRKGGSRGSRANGSMVPGLGGAVHRRALALLPTGRLDSDWVEGAFGSLAGLDADSGGGGGTLQTLLGVRETLTSVQNGLGDAVEMCERIKNLLNWTHPQRTRLVLAAAVALLVVLIVAPFRYLLLAGGVFEFTKGWLLGGGDGESKPPPLPPSSSSVGENGNPEESADGKKSTSADSAASTVPAATAPPPQPAQKKGFLLDNMLATMPSDEALRLAYAHEAKVNRGLVTFAREIDS